MKRIARPSLFVLLLAALPAAAGVLPDDRTDLLYHRYDGGGVTIDGPSLLMRKKVGKSVSVVGNYYVDMVSSASIDVVTTASPYTEERKQWSLGMDYLRGDTTMSVGYTNSVESDFDAKTWSLSVSQAMFGDLTTLTLSYALGNDEVGRSDDENFTRDNTRQHYGIALSQILTRNLITTLNFETITDEGFLNNPYRSVRYADATSGTGYSYEPELYPATRSSNAVGIRARYFLPYRAAIQGEYRFFTDTWKIESNTLALEYMHPLGPWTLSARYRWYDQTGASFYSDLFPRAEATNFRARDKELSPLTSTLLSVEASYEFLSQGWQFIDKGTVTASFSRLHVDYDNFSDLTAGAPVGSEPLYQLDADVIQIFFSFWY
ncbi:MAG: DUF3570 domain-containing protein [Woeseia sp.]